MPKCPFHNNHMDGAMNFTIRDEVTLCLCGLYLSEFALHMSVWPCFSSWLCLLQWFQCATSVAGFLAEYLQLNHCRR